jgi:hypothetical protein
MAHDGQGEIQNSGLEQVNSRRGRENFRQRNEIADGDYRRDPLAFNSLILRNFADWGGAWDPDAWRIMTPLFSRLKDLGREHNFKILIVAFPATYQMGTDFPSNYPQEQLKKVAQSLDLPVLDLLPPLSELGSARRETLFCDHCHFTPEGNRVVAAMIFAELLKRLPADEPPNR